VSLRAGGKEWRGWKGRKGREGEGKERRETEDARVDRNNGRRDDEPFGNTYCTFHIKLYERFKKLC
jgi:hypothetical protein